MGCVCSSMVDWVHYYGLHEFQECSELGRITFESSSIQLQALFFSQKAFVWVALGFFFWSTKLQKFVEAKKDTAGTPFLYKISIYETVLGALKFWPIVHSSKCQCFKFDARK